MSEERSTDTQQVRSLHDRRRRNRQETINTILDVAREVIREEGVAALNLNEVARRVGVRPQSLYEYFPSKAAMYDTLFQLGIRLYRERRDHALQAHPVGWDRVRAWLENYMAFAQEYPELYQLIFERPVPGFVPSEASMEESRQLLATGQQSMTELIDAGVLAPGLPPAQAMDLFIAMMHGLAALHIANEPHLAVGSGRFGSLVPAAIALFQSVKPPITTTTTAANNLDKPEGTLP